jgi:hypothetical protein
VVVAGARDVGGVRVDWERFAGAGAVILGAGVSMELAGCSGVVLGLNGQKVSTPRSRSHVLPQACGVVPH